MDRRVEIVDRMWEAYRRRGLEAILDFAAPDAVWEPYSADRRRFESNDSYRRHVQQMSSRGESVEAHIVSVEPEGDDAVIVTGRLRVRRAGALEDAPMHWLHRFRGDEIVYTYSSPHLDDVREVARRQG